MGLCPPNLLAKAPTLLSPQAFSSPSLWKSSLLLTITFIKWYHKKGSVILQIHRPLFSPGTTGGSCFCLGIANFQAFKIEPLLPLPLCSGSLEDSRVTEGARGSRSQDWQGSVACGCPDPAVSIRKEPVGWIKGHIFDLWMSVLILELGSSGSRGAREELSSLMNARTLLPTLPAPSCCFQLFLLSLPHSPTPALPSAAFSSLLDTFIDT